MRLYPRGWRSGDFDDASLGWTAAAARPPFAVASLAAKEALPVSLRNFPAASFEDVGRCHTQEYISFLQELAQEVSSTGDAVPFTPQVQRRAPCL